LHIGAWQEVFLQRLMGQAVDEPKEGDFPPATVSGEQEWKAAQQMLERSHRKLLEYYATLQNSQLDDKVIGKDYSTAFMLHGIIRHHVYHAGQIGLLKKLIRQS